MNSYRVNRGRDTDGSYLSDDSHRQYVRSRRAEARRNGQCINGTPDGSPSRSGRVHGPANPTSGKCADCEDVARRSRL